MEQSECAPRRKWLHELRDVGVLMLLGFAMTLAGLSCRQCTINTPTFWIMASFTSLMWIVLWKGNEHLAVLISKRISWIHYPFRRFTIGLIGTFAFTLLGIYGLVSIYKAIFDINISSSVLYSVIITLVISLFLHGRAFLQNWRQSAIDAERLKRENIASRYETLKNQVNPHFLFNSFNALSNLVHQDPDTAVRFIKQLSEVYRYVLDTRDKEVVPISEELRFLSSYSFLQQIRFGDKLKIETKEMPENVFVAPLALQMLIENAIKHNVVSEEAPLFIDVSYKDGFVVVSNNLQKKAVTGEASAGVGLDNIVHRYQFLSNQRAIIEETSSRFTVKLPALKA